MKTKELVFSSLLACTVGVLTLRRFKPTSAKSTSNGTLYDRIDAFIEQEMRRLNIPGVSLAIVEGNKIVHCRGFGRARPGGAPPSPQTPFFIGSLTKSFTALAVMQLVEAGKIDLDAPVQRYLPWFRVADRQAFAQTPALAPKRSAGASVTVRHLLNQTSSLPMLLGVTNLGDLDRRPDATERQMRALSTLVLTRPVGSAFEYSNLNYNLLGLIIEATSGESYAEYIQHHIFDPLAMSHSFTSKVKAQKDNLAVGHCYWFGVPIPVPNLPMPLGSLPAGQLIASAEDMAHYLIAYLNGGRYKDAQILSPAGIDEMHRPAAAINEMGMSLGYYGMGWISTGTGESRIVSHSGIVPDFGAFMALIPERKKGIVILINANHAMMKMTYDEVGMQAAQLLAGQTPTPNRYDLIPWVMRGMALIPIVQIISIIATLRQLKFWRENPQSLPSRERIWTQHILLPLIPNLSIALTLIPMLTKMRCFLMLFMPDYSLIAMVCGSFAVVWSFLRTTLILRALGKTNGRTD